MESETQTQMETKHVHTPTNSDSDSMVEVEVEDKEEKIQAMHKRRNPCHQLLTIVFCISICIPPIVLGYALVAEELMITNNYNADEPYTSSHTCSKDDVFGFTVDGYDYKRRFTLEEICDIQWEAFEDPVRDSACAQLRVINAWVVLTSIASVLHVVGIVMLLVLKCTKFGNDHRYMCKQTTKTAFLTSGFCLLGGILWFYMGSPICNGPMTSSGNSVKAVIAVLVLQFFGLFGSVFMNPNDDIDQVATQHTPTNSNDEQEKNPLAFKIIVYILISMPPIVLFYALVAGELMTNYFDEDSYTTSNTCSKDDLWAKYTDDDDTVHHLTLKGICHEYDWVPIEDLSPALRDVACAQLSAINGWTALTSIALVLHVLGIVVLLTRYYTALGNKAPRWAKAAFVTSAFCLLGGIIWFYVGSPICNGQMTESGDSMKAAIAVVVLQFFGLFGIMFTSQKDDIDRE